MTALRTLILSRRHVAIALLSLSIILSSIYVIKRPSAALFRLITPANILILAPHQDDGAITASGLVQQNRELGGKTTIVFMTKSADAEVAQARQIESIRAWAIAGISEPSLFFLDSLNLTDPSEQKRVRQEIIEIAQATDANLLVAPTNIPDQHQAGIGQRCLLTREGPQQSRKVLARLPGARKKKIGPVHGR